MLNEILLAGAIAFTPTIKMLNNSIDLNDFTNNYYEITEVFSFYGKKKIDIICNLEQGSGDGDIALNLSYQYNDGTINHFGLLESNYFRLENALITQEFGGTQYYIGIDEQELSDAFDYMIIQPQQGSNEITIGFDTNDYDYLSSDFEIYNCSENFYFNCPFNISFNSNFPYVVVDFKQIIYNLYLPIVESSMLDYKNALLSSIETQENRHQRELEELQEDLEETVTYYEDYVGRLQENFDFTISSYEEYIENLQKDLEQQHSQEIEKLENEINELLADIETLETERVFNNVFDVFGTGFDAVVNFMKLEIAPNITIGMLISIPLISGALFFVIKILVK